MAKEKVQEAVVEETEVATAEAEVAEATEEVKEDTTTTDETADTGENEMSPWYYFFAQGCGWCKKSGPVVEELNNDGHDVLMLDVAEPDNAKLPIAMLCVSVSGSCSAFLPIAIFASVVVVWANAS